MKKLICKILETLKDPDFLGVLWYIAYVLWFGFVGRIIIISDLHIIAKILMIAGDLCWGFYVFVLHYNNLDEE